MDSAAQQKRSNNRRYIPLEITEKILLHLPIKSVIRFSRVSKPWRSLIFEPNFMKQRAAVHDLRRLVMCPRKRDSRYGPPDLAEASSCSLSSDSAVKNATRIVCPIEGTPINLLASCDELWCVEAEKSLYLWNPSINTYKKLPNPLIPYVSGTWGFIYGLGYDSVSDDYKIFRIRLCLNYKRECELYSLRSDSWRMIDDHPLLIQFQKCVFVGGALHWLSTCEPETIISFDLATEKYGNIAPPRGNLSLSMSVLRSKLSVHKCRFTSYFTIWVMEEYGIEKSWTKIFDVKYGDAAIPQNDGIFRIPGELTPLYLFDNGDILFRVEYYGAACKSPALYMYKGEETRSWKIFPHGICDVFMFQESLFLPASIAVRDSSGAV